MTTIKITLPDELAQEATQAGLLTPELIEKWLRDQLKAQRLGQLSSAMGRMAKENTPSPMSPEQVAEELAAIRAARRSS